LYNVPFNNLVANPVMLPQETIRFFYIDQNWTDALLDGALSIGVQSSRDSLFNQLMRDTLYMEVQQAMAEVRDGLLGVAAQGHTPDITQPAGFLLRSQKHCQLAWSAGYRSICHNGKSNESVAFG
jgi:hypothetical protein